MIRRFFGKYRFLSNFWPCKIMFDGDEYPSVEHAYQSAKTLDLRLRTYFQNSSLIASDAKLMGRKLIVQENWEDLRLGIMRTLVTYKFTEHSDLGVKLLSTGEQELIEGNNWNDTFWGVCNGFGSNHLGIILMSVRQFLRDQ